MQTPPNDQQSPYTQQGFTAVPNGAVGTNAYYGSNQPGGQIPVQSEPAPGMPPAYSPQQGNAPAAYPPPYAPQQGTQLENAYHQPAYQPQQVQPFQQQTPYQAPPTHNYHRLNWILGLIIAALIIVLIVVALSQTMGSSKLRTALVSAGTLGANHSGIALIARNESMYSQDNITDIDYIVEEGATVTRGAQVCTVYTAGFSSKEWNTLRSYRSQIKEYQKTLLASTNLETDLQLKQHNAAVLACAVETQTMVQTGLGNLRNQEQLLSEAIEERAYYLKQKYADDQKLSRLYDDEKTQLQRIETWTRPFAAGAPGIASFYIDGYERVLNLETYSTFSPAQVRQMYSGSLPDSATLGRNEVPVYRLVRQGSYVVLMLCDDPTWTPSIGASYELMMENFENTRVSATVESLTRSEGELLLRLMVNADVTPVLYTRTCHVQLSESIYSLTVPANALTTSEGEIGVVVVQSDGNYFLPVTVISQDNSVAHIVPLLSNILSVGSTVLIF